MQKDNIIGLVQATQLEADPFIKGLSLSQIEENPFNIFSNNNIFLIISGIGKSNSAIATSYIIWKYKIKNMFNIGAAGATKNNMKVGDIYHIDSVIEYDRPRISDGGIRIKRADILKGFNTTSLATQDRPIITTHERDTISKYADLVDMEGASFIQACRLFITKCYLFKFVSDTPQHINGIEIVENIKLVRDSMFNFFDEFVLNSMDIQKLL